MKDNFQAAGSVASDLAASDLAVVRHADFVRNVLVCELFFSLADERNLRDGINSVRITGWVGLNDFAKRVGGGDAALLHGNRGQAGKPDDIAHGVNVGLGSTVVGIYFNAAARIEFDARRREIQLVDVA